MACFFLLTSSVFSQDIAFKNSNFKEDKQGLKLAKESISSGDEIREGGIEKILAMQDANIIFGEAIFYYQKAQDFNQNNAELNYKIGSCYLFTNQKEKAADYLLRTMDLTSDYTSDFLFFYAMVLQLQGNYLQAGEQFEQFKLSVKSKLYERYELLAKKYTKECQGANEILANSHRIWVDNIALNTEFDDWSPCLSADGELLIFTSNQPNENQANEFGIYDQDIYFSTLNARKFEAVLPVSELNTENNDVAGGLSYDGQRLLIFKQEDGNTDVFESKLNGLKWGIPTRKMGEKLRGGMSIINI